MMCRHCGATIEDRAAVCTDCGGLVGRRGEFEHGRKLPRRDSGVEEAPADAAEASNDGLPIGGALIFLALHLVIENLAYLAFIVFGSGMVRDPRLAPVVVTLHVSAVLCLVSTVAFFMRLRVARPLLYVHFGGALVLGLANQLLGFGVSGTDAGLCGIFWLFYLAATDRPRRTFVLGLS